MPACREDESIPGFDHARVENVACAVCLREFPEVPTALLWQLSSWRTAVLEVRHHRDGLLANTFYGRGYFEDMDGSMGGVVLDCGDGRAPGRWPWSVRAVTRARNVARNLRLPACVEDAMLRALVRAMDEEEDGLPGPTTVEDMAARITPDDVIQHAGPGPANGDFNSLLESLRGFRGRAKAVVMKRAERERQERAGEVRMVPARGALLPREGGDLAGVLGMLAMHVSLAIYRRSMQMTMDRAIDHWVEVEAKAAAPAASDVGHWVKRRRSKAEWAPGVKGVDGNPLRDLFASIGPIERLLFPMPSAAADT